MENQEFTQEDLVDAVNKKLDSRYSKSVVRDIVRVTIQEMMNLSVERTLTLDGFATLSTAISRRLYYNICEKKIMNTNKEKVKLVPHDEWKRKIRAAANQEAASRQ